MFKNLLLVFTRRFRQLQTVSDRYWQQSNYTYLASKEYYRAREAALVATLQALPPLRLAVDVGCGDGHFTRLIAQRAATTIGYDLAPALIAQARQAAAGDLQSKLSFEVAGIDDIRMSEQASLVACMGVLSCLIDDARYARALRIITDLIEPGGFLLLIDTLAESREITRAYRNGYVARYRRQADYERALHELGVTLVERKTISAMNAGTTNSLFLLRRAHPATLCGSAG